MHHIRLADQRHLPLHKKAVRPSAFPEKESFFAIWEWHISAFRRGSA
jgi:hypothetical protein